MPRALQVNALRRTLRVSAPPLHTDTRTHPHPCPTSLFAAHEEAGEAGAVNSAGAPPPADVGRALSAAMRQEQQEEGERGVSEADTYSSDGARGGALWVPCLCGRN